MSIWTVCKGKQQITVLNETAWRVVESQYITATRKLTDSLDEQVLLEEMIDAIKPELSQSYDDYHYLLYTPFRYPPLKHGSRFGKKSQPSLWYGSLDRNAVLAEKAYYQFNFLRAINADIGLVEIPLNIFSVPVYTERGIYLERPPFAAHRNQISSPVVYQASQQLGDDMRSADVEAFTYFSARCDKINIALFTPLAFKKKQPNSQLQSWVCYANSKTIEFIRVDMLQNSAITFSLLDFQIDGELPFPAA